MTGNVVVSSGILNLGQAGQATSAAGSSTIAVRNGATMNVLSANAASNSAVTVEGGGVLSADEIANALRGAQVNLAGGTVI